MRGVESTAYSFMRVNNEVEFCKVYGLKQKEDLARVFLQNRISYFVKCQDNSFWKRMFGVGAREKGEFIMCIHDTAVPRALTIIKGMPEVKLLISEHGSREEK